MPLTTGARVGPYEIVGALGAGGMGEVYRARDTRLKRDVAVKVLPDAFSRDADRTSGSLKIRDRSADPIESSYGARGPRSSLTGSMMIPWIISSTPSTATPTIRNGSKRIQTIGYMTRANSANGQHSTRRMHQTRNFSTLENTISDETRSRGRRGRGPRPLHILGGRP